jgi:AcrR family transcriptional regulator
MRRDERRTTQRERLLDGMLAAVAREGYAGATVSRAIANAGVSRPTFYEYFPDRDACFLATHERAARGLLEYVREGVREEEPRQAFRGAACALLRHAEEQRDATRLLGDQALAAGSRALDARDAALAQLARVDEEALARAAPDASAPDLPARALLGGLQRSLAAWLRNSALHAASPAQELTALLASFERPLGEHRWRALRPGPPLRPSPHVATLALQAPRPLPPGRSRASHAEIERNQRERILFATAGVASERGYGATTVSDILAAARVDRRVFYAHFRGERVLQRRKLAGTGLGGNPRDDAVL